MSRPADGPGGTVEVPRGGFEAATGKEGVFHRFFSSSSARSEDLAAPRAALPLRLGSRRELALGQHLRGLVRIGEQIAAAELVGDHHPQLEHAAMAANAVKKGRLNCSPRASARATLRSTAIMRSVSMTAAMSISIGQRVVQASHEAHSQMACESSTSALGAQMDQPHDLAGKQVHLRSDGQPVEHLWHWKHALTGVPLRRSTSRRNPSVIPFERVGHRYAPSPSISASASASLAGITLRYTSRRVAQHFVHGQKIAFHLNVRTAARSPRGTGE